MHPLIPFRPNDNAALAGRHVLITAGERDPICPAPQTQALADYFKAQGTATEIEWHAGGHDIRQNEISATERFIKG
ncbi:putative hydrolase MhqD [compost metagenome]